MRVLTLLALIGALGALVSGCGAAHESDPSAAGAFRRAVLAQDFASPVLVTHAPGEPRTLYVVEQTGRVLRIVSGRRRVVLDVRQEVEFGGERGLLGLAFHPKYSTNRLFYVAYTTGDRNVVARYRSNGVTAVASSRKLLLSVPDPYGNHNGGHLAVRGNVLYTTIGDGGSGGDPENRSQNMQSQFGKLLALNVSKTGATWTIVGLGLRNAWRFSFDRANGDLYIGDVGQNAVEEVDYTPNRSPGLENYGWNLYEGTQRHSQNDPGPGQLVFPVYEYSQSVGGCSVIGGYVYRGRSRPAERGRYVFGDYCTGIVWSLRVRSGKAEDVRREPFRIEGLTSFGENAAGEIYATSEGGTIYKLT